MQDAQRAIELVHMRAKKWNVHLNKVGIMGFSAGGHVASTVATHLGHSYMHNPTTKDEWMERCKNWMQSMNLLQE